MAELSRKESADLIDRAKRRVSSAQASNRKQHDNFREDMVFYSGDQWQADVKSGRTGRPCLVLNGLPKYVKRVTNVVRMNPPAIEVSPVDSNEDPKVAEIFQGLIRNIEAQSDAKSQYVRVCEHQTIGGLGYIKYTYDYTDSESLDMDIRIHAVRDPLMVLIDEDYDQDECNPMKWAMEFSWRSVDSLKAEYGDDVDVSSWSAPDVAQPSKSGDMVMVGMYWERKDIADKMHSIRIVDPNTGAQEDRVVKESDADFPVAKAALDAGFGMITQTRNLSRSIIRWYVCTPLSVLDCGEWPGDRIPIEPAYGNEMRTNDDHLLHKGLVRDLRDPQQMINWYASYESEAMSSAPLSPWLIEETQVGDYKGIWQNANTSRYSFLPYKAVEGAPPPQRLSAGTDISPIITARARLAEDMKDVTGIADFGYQSASQESGKAVLLKRQQQDILIVDFSDNLNRAIRAVGLGIVGLIPKVYNTARVVRILGEDGSATPVQINTPNAEYKGIQGLFRPGAGRYDVSVSTGPAYSTKRQEAADTFLTIMQAIPNQAPMIADLAVRNIDAPGMDKAADRLAKTLPPELQESEGHVNLDPQTKAMLDQQAQALQQAQTIIEQLQGEKEELIGSIAQLQQQVENNTQNNQTKLAIAEMDNNAKVVVEAIKAGNNIDLAQHNGLTEMGKAFAQASASVKSPNITPIAHKRIPQVAGPVSAQGQSAERMAT